MGDNPESKSHKSAALRVKRALEKEKRLIEDLRAQGKPLTAEALTDAARTARDCADAAEAYQPRLDEHIKALEECLLNHNTDSDVIETEIEPLADFSLECIKWIKQAKNFASDCSLAAKEMLIGGQRTPGGYQPLAQNQNDSVPDNLIPQSNEDFAPSMNQPAGDGSAAEGHSLASTQSPNSPVSHERPNQRDVWPDAGNYGQMPSAPNRPDEDPFFDRIGRLWSQYDNRGHGPQRSVTSATGAAKLPKLQLPKFDGDSGTWRTFWDSFQSSVHDNPTLRPVDKMKYLQGQLSGEALKTIAGLSLNSDNYGTAVSLLTDQYGNPDTQIAAIHARLMQLKPVQNETKKLRGFYLEVESSLRSLENLGQDTENPHFVSLILAKLPTALIILLERAKGARTPWTVSCLRESLNLEITVRESTDRYKSTPENDKTPVRKEVRFDPNVRTGDSLLAGDYKKRQQTFRPNKRCVFCREEHWSDECSKFKTVAERKRQIKGRCYNCLGEKHRQNECQSKRPCYYCKEVGRHHSSLCLSHFPAGNRSDESANAALSIEPVSPPDHEDDQNSIALSDNGSEDTSCLAAGEKVLLQTAVCQVSNLDGSKSERIRVLLDCGSNRSYITESLAKKLELRQMGSEVLRVNRFASEKPVLVRTRTVRLGLRLRNKTEKEISVNVVPNITGSLTQTALSPQIRKRIPRDIQLAEKFGSDSETKPIDLLIGNEYYLEITTGKRMNIAEGLFLIESSLGWILSGRVGTKCPNVCNFAVSLHANGKPLPDCYVTDDKFPANSVLKSSWEDMCKLETIGIHEDPIKTDDDLATEQFESTVTFEDGRYHVSWPWRSNLPELPSNYGLAFGRLKNLLKRFGEQPDLFERYQKILDDQIAKGVVELVSPPTPDKRVHYIAHHPVVTPQKATTKVRIVYDASAKIRKNKPSLNDCLLRGPVILEDLLNLMVRFRLHKVPLIADIEKAFLQVGLHEPDRDFTRFLWLKDPTKVTTDQNLQEYRFTRVPFGMTSSPFLLGATVKHHLDRETESKATATRIRDNLYVDNVVVGCDSVEEAKKLYDESKIIFRNASMNLREWLTSDTEVLAHIPEPDRAKSGNAKLLGILWNSETDCLGIQGPTKPPQDPITKRKVLCFIASVFDPMGLFTPVTVAGKIFFQNLCKQQKPWDQEIFDKDEAWDRLVADLIEICKVKIPRFVGNVKSAGKVVLACFADASTKCYATAVYLVIQPRDGTWDSNLIFARARVNPIKAITMPRLELLSVLIGARAIKYLQKKVPLTTEAVLFTDSKCVWHWLNSQRSLKNFVSRRVEEIKTSYASVRYVKTTDNPADIATRGKPLCEVDETWWKGPPWLASDPQSWPNWGMPEISADVKTDVEKEIIKTEIANDPCFAFPAAAQPPAKSPFDIRSESYSTLTKLLRVTAWCSRFIANARTKTRSTSSCLTAEEIAAARSLWETSAQKLGLADLLDSFKRGSNHPLSKQLGAKLDSDGIIRCYGRLGNSDLDYDTKFPILLPKDHWVTTLVIRQCHKETMHSGITQSLAKVRQRYWIPQGRRQVKSVLTKCSICRRFEGKPYQLPIMPHLPSARVTRNAPFTHTGVDYFGPLHVRGTENSKVWVCLFTCLTVRAIHLELVENCTAEQFLFALRRFVARRGLPTTMVSDNAPQFKQVSLGGDKFWSEIWDSSAIRNFTATHGIRWSFITAYAPWMGGVYERMVQVVKRPLRKALGRTLLSANQLHTVLTEVEHIVNSRPICHNGDSDAILTPNHFLGLAPKASAENPLAPDAKYLLPNDCGQKALVILWKKTKNCLEQFWKLWEIEYLQYLRQKSAWFHKGPRLVNKAGPKVGDVVIVKTELRCRSAWPVGIITDLPSGVDGLVRTAVVKLSNGNEVRRSVGQLYPLEVFEPAPKRPVPENRAAIPEENEMESVEDDGRGSPELLALC